MMGPSHKAPGHQYNCMPDQSVLSALDTYDVTRCLRVDRRRPLLAWLQIYIQDSISSSRRLQMRPLYDRRRRQILTPLNRVISGLTTA
nr:hypothetical protein Iba_chr05cCG1640 [Ipomoea batatas]